MAVTMVRVLYRSEKIIRNQYRQGTKWWSWALAMGGEKGCVVWGLNAMGHVGWRFFSFYDVNTGRNASQQVFGDSDMQRTQAKMHPKWDGLIAYQLPHGPSPTYINRRDGRLVGGPPRTSRWPSLQLAMQALVRPIAHPRTKSVQFDSWSEKMSGLVDSVGRIGQWPDVFGRKQPAP